MTRAKRVKGLKGQVLGLRLKLGIGTTKFRQKSGKTINVIVTKKRR